MYDLDVQWSCPWPLKDSKGIKNGEKNKIYHEVILLTIFAIVLSLKPDCGFFSWCLEAWNHAPVFQEESTLPKNLPDAEVSSP
jgi:hypothetical protein